MAHDWKSPVVDLQSNLELLPVRFESCLYGAGWRLSVPPYAIIVGKIPLAEGQILMSERSKLVTRMTENASKFADADRMEVEELLNEIDNLALLLHEVKRQSDKIEAAADAIGDAILSHLDDAAAAGSRISRRSILPMQPKNVRLNHTLE